MGLFGIGSKKKKMGRPKRNPEAEAEAKRKKFLSDEFIKLAKEDPDMKRVMVASTFGLQLPPKDADSDQRKEIKKLATTEAMKQIKDNPELLTRFVETHLSEIVGGRGGIQIGEEETEFEGESPLSQALDEFEKYDELRKRFGGEGSRVFNAETVNEVLKTVRALVEKNSQIQPPPERMYVVQVNGKITEVPESKYRQLVQGGAVVPVGTLISPPAEQIQTKPAETTTEPKLPEFMSSVDTVTLLSYLELTPEEFVQQIESDTETTPELKFVWDYANTATYDKIVSAIKPFANNEKAGACVERILSPEGKTWTETVLSIIKARSSA